MDTTAQLVRTVLAKKRRLTLADMEGEVCYRPLGDMRRSIGFIFNEHRSPSRAAVALVDFFKAERGRL